MHFMLSRIFNIFCLFQSSISLVKRYDLEDVDTEDCTRPFRINLPPPQKFDMKTLEVNASLYSMKSPQLVHAFRVEKIQARCPDWFTDTFSSGCVKKRKYMSYDRDQIKTIAGREACLVGRECLKGECTGSDVKHCDDDILNRYSSKRANTLPTAEIELFHHSCNLEWDCQYQKKMKPIYADAYTIGFYFYGEDNKRIEVVEDRKEYSSGEWHYYLQDAKEYKEEKTIHCLKSTKRIICKYEENPPEYAIINNHMIGNDKSTRFTLKTDIWTMDQTAIKGDATIEQIRRILTKLEEENLQSNYNFIQVATRIEHIEKFLMHMIRGPRVEDAINTLIPFPNSRIIRLDEGVYTACSLKQPSREPFVKPYLKNVTGITVFNHLELNMEEVSNSIVLDSRYTDSLENLKKKITDKQRMDQIEIERPLQSISGTWGQVYEVISHLAGTIGSTCGMISLLLILFRR